MLMQNFKTAADLDISEKELAAAISVLGMLERGELVHHDCFVPGETPWSGEYQPTVSNGFNMQCAGEQTACGTVACIGGWMAVMMGRKGNSVSRYVNKSCHPPSLHKLFWSEIGHGVTTEQAATALRSYLTTGDARWDLAVQS